MNDFFYSKRYYLLKQIIEKYKIKERDNFIIKSDEDAQAGAEMLLLIGGMIIIVLIAIYFYKDYVINLGEEISSNEINELNNTVNEISSKFV